MSDLTIHNIKISYDESDERVRNFMKYLKSEERKEEMNTYYKQALDSADGKIYISDKNNNEFTLICSNNHICNLRLRGSFI